MIRAVGLWVHLFCACIPVFSQVDTSYIYNPSTSYGVLDLRIQKSPTRYYYLQEGVTFSYRESSPGVKTNTYRDMTNWDSSPYREGNLRERNGNQDLFIMNYRFLVPGHYDPDYDPGYPIILMLHGYGERGNCWFNNCYWSTPSWNPNSNSPPAPTTANSMLLNNDHNLLHGGLKHLQAVNLAGSKKPDDPSLDPKAFPGFVLFPQSLNGWQQAGRVEEAIKILRLMIRKYNIDENRVYIHALSNGGGGLYQAIKRAPWLFAAALPMSAVTHSGAINTGIVDEVAKIPLWVFQGAKDQNPTPGTTYNTIKAIREAGGVVRYSLYGHLGHGTWNTAYNEPEFFSWMLEKRKTNPHITYGNPVICNTNGVGVTISYTKGFFAYQWEKDGQLLHHETSHEISINTPGTIRGRFSRKPNPSPGDWEPWSDPIEVTEINPQAPEVEILTSTHLRGPGQPSNAENNTIRLRVAEEADLYRWYRNGNLLNFPQTDIDDTLRVASVTAYNTTGNGTYVVETVHSFCPSPPSDPVYVFFDNSAPKNMTFDASKANLQGTVIGNGIYLTWKDVVSNESGYEIWRRKSGASHFVYAGRTPKNAISFYDDGLEPATTYEYKLRAVSNTGVSNYIPSDDLNNNYSIITGADSTPPTAPQDLKMVFNTLNSISLTWKAATDNTPIKDYVIDYGSGTVSTGGPVTAFTVTGLPASRQFPVTVKARDFAGNVSPESNQIIASTYVIGLNYKHSTGGWESLDEPSMIATWADPEFTGNVPNITLAPRTQEDFFNFQFTGFLDIPVAGNYQFRLSSDDGSRFFLDGNLLIDNDGQHGNVAKLSDPVFLSAGPHPLEVQYFDYSGGHILTLTYRGPGDPEGAFQNIPDSWFRSAEFVPGATPPKPTGLAANAAGMKRINLSWSGPGATMVEIYRSRASSGPWSIIGKNSAGVFADTVGLLPSTTYYYRARSVNDTGVSDMSGMVSATTSGDNVAPSIPSGLTVNTASHTHASVTWTPATDNVGVTGYEVYLDGTLIGTSGIPAFMISDLLPGTPYAVTVRAYDASNNKSAFSTPLEISTSPSAIYYSTSSGSLTSLDTWKTNADGSGSSPSGFSGNGQFFVISNRTQATLDGSWTVDGEASRVVVGEGVTLTVNAALHAAVELKANSTVELNHAVIPDLVSVHTTSTIDFIDAGNIPANTYGHLKLSGSTVKTFAAGTTTIRGDLTLADGLPLKGASANKSVVVLEGDLTFQGSPMPTAADNRVDLRLSGSSPVIATGGDLYFYELAPAEGSVVTFQQSGDPVTIVFGSGRGGGLQPENGSAIVVGPNHLRVVNQGTLNEANVAATLSVNGGRITFGGSGQSNLYLDATSHVVDSLIVDMPGGGSVNMRSMIHITAGLRVDGGTLHANNFITLRNNAHVAPIGNTGSITGTVHVRRNMEPVNGAWYDLSSPVDGATVEDLQHYFPVNGDFTGASSAGLSTMYVTSEEGLVPWPAAGQSNQAELAKGKGHHVRIDRSTPFTMELSGALHQKDVQLPLSGNGGYNGWYLVGNPYASPIWWTNQGWERSGISNVIATWENEMTGGELVGRFVYHDLLSSAVTIGPGEGFWVQTTGDEPALKIKETAKAVGGTVPPSGDTRVLKISVRKGNYIDDVLLAFSADATEGFDPLLEAKKIYNDGYFNLAAIIGEDMALAVNHLPKSFCSTSVILSLSGAAPGSYTVTFSDADVLAAIGNVTLNDQFTNTTISVSDQPYTFSVTGDEASQGPRFVLTVARADIDTSGPEVISSNICEGDPAVVRIRHTQSGARYRIITSDGTAVSDFIEAVDDTVTLTIPTGAIRDGHNTFRVQAGFDGCDAYAELNEGVEFSYTPVFDISAEETVTVCAGATAVLEASGAPQGGTYRWFDSDSNELSYGTASTFVTTPITHETVYYVAGVHPDGCESERRTIYVFPDSLTVPVVAQTGDTLYTQVDANYQWRRNGMDITGATRGFYVPDRTAYYSVVVSRGDCVKESEALYFVIDPDCEIDTSTPRVTVGDVCGEGIAEFTITNSQANVSYFLMNSAEEPLSHTVTSPGGTIVLTVDVADLDSGMNKLFVRTDLEGCVLRTLDSAVMVNNVILQPPVFSYVDYWFHTDSTGAIQWKVDGAPIEGATSSTYWPGRSGSYTVEVTIGGCTVESEPYALVVTSLERDYNDGFMVDVFPVPSKPEQVTMKVRTKSNEPVYIRVIDMNGRTIFNTKHSGEPGEIPLRSGGKPLTEGLYILIGNQGEYEVRKRFVIKNQ